MPTIIKGQPTSGIAYRIARVIGSGNGAVYYMARDGHGRYVERITARSIR